MVGYRLTTVCDSCGWAQEHSPEQIDKGYELTRWFDGSWELEYIFTCKSCGQVKTTVLVGKHYIENEYFNRPSCVRGR